MRYWRLILTYFRMQLKTEFHYRTNLAVGFISQVIFTVLSLVFIRTYLPPGSSINGWGFWQIAWMLGMGDISFGLSSIFVFRALVSFNSSYLINGELDQLLVQPVHPLAGLLLRNISTNHIVVVIKGSILLVIAYWQLMLKLSLLGFFFMISGLFLATVIYGGIFITVMSIGFWLRSRSNLATPLLSLNLLGQMPLIVYPELLQFILSFVIPLGFTAFFPAQIVLSSVNSPGTAWSVLGLLVVVAIVTGAVAWIVFSAGLKRYESAGT